jgi:hypothetical protein
MDGACIEALEKSALRLLCQVIKNRLIGEDNQRGTGLARDDNLSTNWARLPDCRASGGDSLDHGAVEERERPHVFSDRTKGSKPIRTRRVGQRSATRHKTSCDGGLRSADLDYPALSSSPIYRAFQCGAAEPLGLKGGGR